MSDGKATIAKRTRKKASALAEATKLKTPTTAATTKGTTSKRSVSDASADVAPAAANSVSQAPGASKARTTSSTVRTAANASALKSPGPDSVTPEGLGKSNGASSAGKVIGEVILPARKAATSKPEGEVRQTALAGKSSSESLLNRPTKSVSAGSPQQPTIAQRSAVSPQDTRCKTGSMQKQRSTN